MPSVEGIAADNELLQDKSTPILLFDRATATDISMPAKYTAGLLDEVEK